ncbi:uncharacterized protein TNCV_1688071 [Trichonephila clavipes]|nr:uncharacterized protein TNCV_1688071 [Trichonephila clavipes]
MAKRRILGPPGEVKFWAPSRILQRIAKPYHQALGLIESCLPFPGDVRYATARMYIQFNNRDCSFKTSSVTENIGDPLQGQVWGPKSDLTKDCKTIRTWRQSGFGPPRILPPNEELYVMPLFKSDSGAFRSDGYLSAHVNTHNTRIRSLQNPHEVLELQRDSPKLNAFCSISRRKVYGPFIFGEASMTGSTYLDALQLCLIPQLEEKNEQYHFIWQQDGAPPHWHLSALDWLSITVLDQWIICKGTHDKTCFSWSSRSPDFTPCDFYLWGFIKDCVYVPPIPSDLPDLRHRIVAAVSRLTSDTLNKVWDVLAYRLDVCRVANGAHIGHL